MRTLRIAPFAFAACLLAAGASAAPRQLGVNIHQSTTTGPDVAKLAGVGWVRADFNWNDIEPSQGVFQWAQMDAIVAAADARGLRVLAVLAYTPAWASAGNAKGDASTNDVPKPGLYEAFVTAAVSRYGGKITHYELWNEPNLEQFFEGTSSDYVSLVLVPGAKAVHAACPSCKVLGPGIATIGGKYDVFLDDVLAKGASSLDVVSGHAYAGFPGLDSGAGSSSDSFFNKLEKHRVLESGGSILYEGPRSMKEVMDARGVTKPFWMTETGREAKLGDAKALGEQTIYTRKVLEAMLTRPWWEATLFYEAFDVPGQPYTWGWAVETSPVTKKPVLDLLKQVTGAQPAFGGDGNDCNDGLDNDGDGKVDAWTDADCADSGGKTEAGPSGAAGAGGAAGQGASGGAAGASTAGTSGGPASPATDEGASDGGGCSTRGAGHAGAFALLALASAMVRRRYFRRRYFLP